jgi:hypothetical protein
MPAGEVFGLRADAAEILVGAVRPNARSGLGAMLPLRVCCNEVWDVMEQRFAERAPAR